MKQKDVVYLGLAAVVLTVTGILGYSILAPKSASSAASSSTNVEVVAPILSKMDDGSLSGLRDPAVTKDFTVPVDLTGLGTTALFGPLSK
jgi:hypothetical protein